MVYEQLNLILDGEAEGFQVREITYERCIPFIMGIHYARRMPCIQYAFGAFINGELVGVVTYGQPASPSLTEGVAGKENKGRVLELNRLAIQPETTEPNVASRLVGRSLRMLPKGMIIVSYADAEGWGHVGYVYQATNWMYTGMTKSRTDKYSESGHSRHYKGGETKRQYRTAKHRYIYITGKGKERESLRKQIRYPILGEYPKGDSRRYDTKDPIPQRDTKTS